MNIFGEDADKRKAFPLYRGLFKYFPNALAAVAKRSHDGCIQHEHDGIYWDRNKSNDDKDALVRHILEEDWDAVAWRALAVLQKELEDDVIVGKMISSEVPTTSHWVDCDGYVSKEVSEPDEDFPMVVRILTDGGFSNGGDRVGQLRKARRYSPTLLDVFDLNEGILSYYYDHHAMKDEVEVIYAG